MHFFSYMSSQLWWSCRYGEAAVMVKLPLWWSCRVRDLLSNQLWLNMEHHGWVSINTSPHSEACFGSELGLMWAHTHSGSLPHRNSKPHYHGCKPSAPVSTTELFRYIFLANALLPLKVKQSIDNIGWLVLWNFITQVLNGVALRIDQAYSCNMSHNVITYLDLIFVIDIRRFFRVM